MLSLVSETEPSSESKPEKFRDLGNIAKIAEVTSASDLWK